MDEHRLCWPSAQQQRGCVLDNSQGRLAIRQRNFPSSATAATKAGEGVAGGTASGWTTTGLVLSREIAAVFQSGWDERGVSVGGPIILGPKQSPQGDELELQNEAKVMGYELPPTERVAKLCLAEQLLSS